MRTITGTLLVIFLNIVFNYHLLLHAIQLCLPLCYFGQQQKKADVQKHDRSVGETASGSSGQRQRA
jgi:hypothetical protein